jgi:hypothetical protein
MEWKNIARQESGLSLARFLKCNSTGASTTVRISGILKLYPDFSEFELLQHFEKLLGLNYPSIFPRFRELGKIGGQYVVELEYVGDNNLENVLTRKNACPEIEPARVIEKVFQSIKQFVDIKLELGTAQSCRRLLLAEIMNGLTYNIEVSGLNANLPSDGEFLHRTAFIPTLCHRDLSATNVMCDVDSRVRLIDPRRIIPGATGQFSYCGSAAIDCASFQVSLERKEAERKHLGLPFLGLVELFNSKITNGFLNQGVFNELMYNLCLAYSYSIYVACPCEYCLAPERGWLYKLMSDQLKNNLRRIT